MAEFAAELWGVGRGTLRRSAAFRQGENRAVVEVPVFFGGIEGQVGPDKTDRQKERHLRGGAGGLETADGLLRELPVPISGVRYFRRFKSCAAGEPLGGFVIKQGFLAGQATRRPAFRQSVVDRFRRPVGHAPRGGILAVAMAHVQDFSHAFRLPALLLEVLGQGDGVGGRFAEIGAQIVNTKGGGPDPGHEGIPGRGADRLVAVGPVKNHAPGGQAVDVGGLDGFVAITTQQGLQVIDTNHQHVGFGHRTRGHAAQHQQGKCQKGKQRTHGVLF